MPYTDLIKASDVVAILQTFSETSDIIPLDGRGLKKEEIKTGKTSVTTAVQILSYEPATQFSVNTEGCITTLNFALLFVGKDQKTLTNTYLDFLSNLFITSKSGMGKYIGNKTIGVYTLHEFKPLANSISAIPENWGSDKWFYDGIFEASISKV